MSKDREKEGDNRYKINVTIDLYVDYKETAEWGVYEPRLSMELKAPGAKVGDNFIAAISPSVSLKLEEGEGANIRTSHANVEVKLSSSSQDQSAKAKTTMKLVGKSEPDGESRRPPIPISSVVSLRLEKGWDVDPG